VTRRFDDAAQLLAPVLLVVATAVLGSFTSRAIEIYFLTAIVSVAIVVAIYVFVGNSGVLSFGQISFVAVGAFAAGVMTIPLESKTGVLPDLYPLLREHTIGNLPSLVLAAAVLLWVAGFDTIYACQDVEFDRAAGLHSLPARLGVARALSVARGMHAAAVLLLAALYWLTPLHPLYLAGVAVVAALLAWEHTLVRPDDLRRVMHAFNLNGWVSLGYFAATAAAAWLAAR